MRFSHVLVGLAVAIVVTCPMLARGETAEQAFARGNTLLKKGDLQASLQAYSAAARAQRTNQEYVQQFMLARQAVALRERLDREKSLQRWQRIAQSLRSFYVSQGVYSEALSVDEKIHAKLNNASSAAQLAETQLAMDRDADAVQVLAALDRREASAGTQALLGIALARQGQVDEARKIAQGIVPPDKAGPGTLYRLARMHAVVGNHDEGLGLLTRCFEAVAPSRLDGFKMHAKQSPAFEGLASTDAFAAVLQTKSKVAESKCSGGKSCAGCPMRGKCAKSPGK